MCPCRAGDGARSRDHTGPEVSSRMRAAPLFVHQVQAERLDGMRRVRLNGRDRAQSASIALQTRQRAPRGLHVVEVAAALHLREDQALYQLLIALARDPKRSNLRSPAPPGAALQEPACAERDHNHHRQHPYRHVHSGPVASACERVQPVVARSGCTRGAPSGKERSVRARRLVRPLLNGPAGNDHVSFNIATSQACRRAAWLWQTPGVRLAQGESRRAAPARRFDA